jgi:hypothetical protein
VKRPEPNTNTVYTTLQQQQTGNHNNSLYSCYYCDNFETNNKRDYESHVVLRHPRGKLCYPSKADLKLPGIQPKGKDWEIWIQSK